MPIREKGRKINELSNHFKLGKKIQQSKPKESRRKGLMKVRAEIKENKLTRINSQN